MSYLHSNAIREMDTGEFDGAIQRYIFIEAGHQADSRGILYRTTSELAESTMVSRTTISKEFARLEKKGLLTREKFGRYRVRLPAGLMPVLPKETKPKAEEPELAQATAQGVSIEDDLGNFSDLEEEISGYQDIDGTYRTPSSVSEPIPDCLKQAVAEGIIKERAIATWVSEPYGVTGFYHVFYRVKPLVSARTT